MMQNIIRCTRGTHVEHKAGHKPWLYPNRFQVTANGMKKWKIVQKTLISEISKDATLKRSAYLERTEKIL